MHTKHLNTNLLSWKKLTLLFLTVSIFSPLWADLCEAPSNGFWSQSSTWTCGKVPSQGDVIRIKPGATVTISPNTLIDLSSGAPTFIIVEFGADLFIQAGASLRLATGSFITLDPPPFPFLPLPGEIYFGDNSVNTSIHIGGTVVSGASGPTISGGAVGFTIDESTILPIELAYFSADQQPNGIRLAWQTLREVNNSHFTLERSVDGNIFEPLTTMQGAGNSEVPLTYEYTDFTASKNVTYYRLKQTDFDGAFTYSHMISIEHTGQRKLQATLFPNPASEVATLNLVGGMINPVEVLITDAMGRAIYRETTAIPEVRIPVDQWVSGIYIYRVVENEQVVDAGRFVVN